MSADRHEIADLGGAAPLCLFGAGGHGQVVAAQIRARAPAVRLCFGDGARRETELDGIVLRYREIEEVTESRILVTVGDNATRRRLHTAALGAELELARVVIDPDRFFASPPGTGTQVLAGAVVNTGARIGTGVIVNSGAVVEHDSLIGDFCHMAPGSIVGGGAVLGAESLLGTNATVLPGVQVAPGCVIGAGGVVTADLSAPGTYVGVPVRCLPDSGRTSA